ncbi:sensor histidine kinase [Acanthopleuribacter pedis]|uniref:Histidine kinase n=1 Tax=Acanthopleuribacter pedis TaxID=442870 RepID=A0A8J7QKB2_9BACT|nr:histidine kinase [Acanthopleuribacter pedis]MBO1322556.1 histidine kinase [Acanthopleuribacter pedis]
MGYFLGHHKLLRLWLLLAAIFVILAFAVNLIVVAVWGKTMNWYGALAQILVYFMWVLFVPAVFAIHKRVPFEGHRAAFFAKHLVMGLGLCILHRFLVELGLAYWLIYIDAEDWGYLDPAGDTFLFAMRVLVGALENLFLYVLTLAFVYLLWYEGRFRDEAVLRSQAEKGKVLAELEALKMQVQPHFLFNAFNSLATLMEENPEEAQEYLGRLGELLHHALDHQVQDRVTVAEEAAFAENYLAIQAVRFSDRMQVQIDAAPDLLQQKVPAFLLQPLVENTIKHGVSASLGPHQVAIRIFGKPNRTCFEVTNTWADAGPDRNTEGHGLGLSGLRKRLELLYPEEFVMDVEPLAQGFRVLIELPGGVA